MSRDLRWGRADEYLIRRLGQARFHFRGFAPTTPRGCCCRCGRRPNGTGRLYIATDRTRNEVLEYGIDCWPRRVLPAVASAIDREADPARKQLLEANYALFTYQDLSGPYWEPTDQYATDPSSAPLLVGAASAPADSIDHNPPEVSLVVSAEEAMRQLRSIPHQRCRDAIDNNWKVNSDGSVTSQSVAWLYCWGKTGMNSRKAAAASRRVFDAVFDVRFAEYDELVDHDSARGDRYR
jgi:hypothetical protein